jgi:hypothetical protein
VFTRRFNLSLLLLKYLFICSPVLVGYSNHHKGWKLYDPITKCIVVSNNVHFDSETNPFNGIRQAIPSLTDSRSAPSDSELRGNTDEMIFETTSVNPESSADSTNASNGYYYPISSPPCPN